MLNELNYRALVSGVRAMGYEQSSRNGKTTELFGTSLELDVSDDKFPLITGRKMFPKGIIGEALALLQTNCTHVDDFINRGCNYWGLWAEKDGSLNLDYSIKDKIQALINDIKTTPNSRRHIIDNWNSENVEELSLPCCHYSYQFNIQGEYIDMIWTQRSADLMVGVPSDMVLATIYLRLVAAATGYKARHITMNFGSTHIYSEHYLEAMQYLNASISEGPCLGISDKPLEDLINDDFEIIDYNPSPRLIFELKA